MVTMDVGTRIVSDSYPVRRSVLANQVNCKGCLTDVINHMVLWYAHAAPFLMAKALHY